MPRISSSRYNEAASKTSSASDRRDSNSVVAVRREISRRALCDASVVKVSMIHKRATWSPFPFPANPVNRCNEVRFGTHFSGNTGAYGVLVNVLSWNVARDRGTYEMDYPQ